MFCFIFIFSSFFVDKNVSYIEKYHTLAIQEMHLYGVPASISLAQALLESDAGESNLAKKANNHFGITCKNKTTKCSKNHCVWHNDAGTYTRYRKYKTVEASWRHHSIWLQKPRYAHLKSFDKDFKKWAKGLQSAGYAIDSLYAQKLIEKIETYKLYEYDK